MTNQYRKKPVVIEAFQMTRERRASNADWPQWLHDAWQKDWSEAGAVSCEGYPNSNGDGRLVIQTLEGAHIVGWGDWIIKGVHGELYPCKPDIFALTYEPVGSAQPLAAAAAAAEIERLKRIIEIKDEICFGLLEDLLESERQRKILAEQLERLGRAGIDAAVGAE